MTTTSFETLVGAHSAEIFAYLWRILGVVADAEDCLQETFLRAWRAYPRLNAGTNHRAWLYKIATNTAYTHLRRKGRLAAQAAELDPQLPDPASSLADEVYRHETLAAVAAAVADLPSKQRAALIMRKYQELSYSAIALALDCTEAAARANVYQALRKLRTRFTEASEGSEGVP